MPKHNKEVKQYLLFVVAVLLAFIASVVGLDAINRKVDEDINNYKTVYEAQLKAN